jgi:site-specific recombinase XerD
MASLINRRDVWYARVLWYKPNATRQTEKQIPLRTKSKVTARERLSMVQKVEDEIIELHSKNEKYSFPWMNKIGKRKVEYLTFECAIERWIKLRKSQGIASSTIERNRQSMNTIMSVLGKSIRLSSVITRSIERYTEVMSLKGYKPNGININLRTLTTFLTWAYRRGDIDKLPFVPKVKVDKALPSYLSDTDFDRLIKKTDEHFAKVFHMYRNTGFRLTEPILGILKNDILVIRAKFSKTRKERRILLSPEDVPVVYELQEYYNAWRNKVKVKKVKYFANKYSKEFKRVCRLKKVGLDNKFHDLRHTFAVRRYLMTRDIYQVMKELGHTKVTTTQIYTEFEDTIDIQKEFPSIINTSNKPISGKMDTNMMDTNRVYSS